MGMGMQIAYFGFAGSAALEAEAGAQLVRLDRFRALISGCHLAIESRATGPGQRAYDVRLDLITRNNELKPVPHCVGDDANEAVRCAFAQAERELLAWQVAVPKGPSGAHALR
ncbi:metal ABC transporter ATPase [Burkholderia sp. Bp8963]|uniref:metal ABC transporter ATPase n=1 Tax=Burkholderia sp. Bp8963 TaxID=2184547 RepID=UPI000F5B3E21|nr:metal ABC transporter ATPase [Burkholderia sp. Bp8963]RQS76831.1 metal ABC transporter ATPase [Burkholderia sp. Bp8963]